jgi:hypothetical protein
LGETYRENAVKKETSGTKERDGKLVGENQETNREQTWIVYTWEREELLLDSVKKKTQLSVKVRLEFSQTDKYLRFS